MQQKFHNERTYQNPSIVKFIQINSELENDHEEDPAQDDTAVLDNQRSLGHCGKTVRRIRAQKRQIPGWREYPVTQRGCEMTGDRLSLHLQQLEPASSGAAVVPLSLGFLSTQSPMMAPSSSTEPATTSPYTAVSSRLLPYSSTRNTATAKFHIRSPWGEGTRTSGPAGEKFLPSHPDSDPWDKLVCAQICRGTPEFHCNDKYNKTNNRNLSISDLLLELELLTMWPMMMMMVNSGRLHLPTLTVHVPRKLGILQRWRNLALTLDRRDFTVSASLPFS